ncbi:PTS galactitol transporter subunit IIC [Candidatus Epulonipiscium viviparus]|uniref:PTS galactitol transporter subunit IIC n=1 Tax=Candidatus Epulonipiscium viviparus TaxID=420336 RepID=UPI0027380E02|nr:PTS transporter subunit IIC [Candidatus Epulopiscium viviparus]
MFDWFLAGFNAFIDLGAAVMMPIIFFILGLIVKVKPSTALKSGLLMGVGFEGIGVMVGLMLDGLSPAANAIVDRLGLNLTVVDVGWPVAAQIGWGTAIVPFAVIGAIVINIIFLAFKWTRVVNIDLYNFNHFMIIGAIIYAGTGNLLAGIVCCLVVSTLALILGDKVADKIVEDTGVENVTYVNAFAGMQVPVAMAVNKIIEKIPKVRDINMSSAAINKRFGIVGEPIALGLIMGVILGIGAGFDINTILQLSIKISAAMVLLPKMVGILVEGLEPIKEAMKEMLKKKMPDRDIFLALDVGMMITDETLAVGILLIPVALLLAVILPGNKVLPLVDLSSLFWFVVMIKPFCKGNMFRMFITGCVILVISLYVAGDIAPMYTLAAEMAGTHMPEGASAVTNLITGATSIVAWIVTKIGLLF